jgi:hypothetical protein
MGRSLRFAPLLAALLVGACNAVFGLDATNVRGEDDTKAGAAGDGGAAGGGPAGQAGESSGAAGEAGGAGGMAGVAGEAGAAGVGGEAGGQGGGGQGGGQAGGGACETTQIQQQKACEESQCGGQTLKCDDDTKPCEFRCSGVHSCEGSKFECPPEQDCRILCEGVQACQNAAVKCGSGSCEVICRGDDEACLKMVDIDCSKSKTCQVTCDEPQDDPPNVKCENNTSGCFCGRMCAVLP